MKVKYVGDVDLLITNLHKVVKPGEVLDVDDKFDNVLFVPIEEETKKEAKKGAN